MKKSIIVVRYDRMHNEDFMNLCYKLISILQTFDLKALQLDELFQNFERKVKPLLEKLTFTARKMPQTEEIDALRKRLEELISALLLYVKSLQRADFDEQKESIDYCFKFIRKLFKNYVHESIPTRSSMIYSMFLKTNTDPKMKLALEKLGIDRFMEEISRVENLMEEKESERREISSKLPEPGSALAAKDQIIVELKYLLMSIELKKLEHTQTDYEPLINLINMYLTKERAQLKNLATRRKTRKAKEDKTKDENNNEV